VKVAYLVNRYPRTSHSFIRREIRALEGQGVEVLRYSLRPLDEELATEADREEVPRTRVVLAVGATGLARAVAAVAASRPVAFARAAALAFRLGRRSYAGMLRHVAYLAEACVLRRWLAAAGADHLHAHFGTNPAAVALLCRTLGGPPYSFTAHGPDEFDKPEALKLGDKIHGAAFVVGVSSYGRSQLWRWSRPDDWPKVQVVHCGLDGDFLAAPPQPVPEARRLVCVARLHEQKGHLLLVEAAERLAREGLDFEIVLAGDGPLRGAIEERVSRAGLAGRVRVAGWMGADRVRDAILASRAMVLPSFAEGLPVTLMESLALGRPVVTTAIAGIPELVETGVTGWLVPAGSVDALARAMREALLLPAADLERMGRAGAERVASRHSAATEAARLLAHFRAAAGAGLKAPRPPA
jgi:glycosyltransferase involved in cell wall biosynthesis